jgi:acyl-CoA dehydrogenase
MTDTVMGLYGGGFKQKEMLSARFGDILSWMYFLTATLKRFEAEGEQQQDRVYVEFIGAYAMTQIQKAYEDIYANIGSGFVNFIFRYVVGFIHRINTFATKPSDRLYIALAEKLSHDNVSRNTLTEGIYLPEDETEALTAIDRCFEHVLEAKSIKAKIKKALRSKTLQKGPTLYADALDADVITTDEFEHLVRTQEMSEEVVQVDTFKVKDYLARR